MPDPYDLQRFVDAQSDVYEDVQHELRAGKKTSHWMWFVFPQLRGLGKSPMAERYAIGSLDEARAYSGHNVLGPRLHQSTALVVQLKGRSIDDILGFPDNRKFHSSMTLFAQAASANQIFLDALQGYFGGTLDGETLKLLS